MRISSEIESVIKRFYRQASQLTRLVAPNLCPVCLSETVSSGLCAPCWHTVQTISCHSCQQIGRNLCRSGICRNITGRGHNPAMKHLDEIRTPFAYQGAIRKLIRDWKYHDQLYLGKTLSGPIIQISRDILSETDILLPVPLHWRRLARRTYNQSAELARILSQSVEFSGKYIPKAVQRTRSTQSNFKLSRSQRDTNLSGAFAIEDTMKRQITGANVTIVDDVITTGATTTQIAVALRRAGARSVNALAIARVASTTNIT